MSIIVSTIGNVEALGRFLASLRLCDQLDQVELIVVDQTPGRVCHQYVTNHPVSCPIKLVTSARGLSVGRNVGLSQAVGEFVSFPDDDCEYVPNVITLAFAHFDSDPRLSVVSGRQLTPAGHDSGLRWRRHSGLVTRNNFYRTTISSSLFLRRGDVTESGAFDEEMGVGAASPWQAGEESDLILRLLACNAKVVYDPAIVVHHGDPRAHPSSEYVSKMRSYGQGQGYLWRKQALGGFRQRVLLVRKLGKIIISIALGRYLLARADIAYVRGVRYGRRRGAFAPRGMRAAPLDELKRNYMLRFAAAGLGLVATFVVTVLAVRTLSHRGANTYFGVLAALFIGPMIGRLGLGANAIRELSGEHSVVEDKGVASRSIWATATLSVMSAPVVAWLSTAGLAGESGRWVVVVLVSIVIVLEAIRLTISDVFSGFGHIGWSVTTTHHTRSVAVVCCFGLYLLLAHRPNLIALLLVHTVVGLALLVVALCRLASDARLGLPERFPDMLTFIRIGLVLSGVDFAAFFVGRGDVWLASFAFDPLDATRYSTASVLAFQITVPVGLASIALAPTVSRLWKRHEVEGLRKLLNAVTTLSTAFTGLCVIALWVAAGPLLERLYGAQLRPAALPLQLLATGSLAVAAFGASSILLVMTGHGRPAALVALGSVLVIVPIGFISVALGGGVVTLAVVSALASPFLFIGQWLTARRYIGFAPTPGLSVRRALAEIRGSRPGDGLPSGDRVPAKLLGDSEKLEWS